MVVVGVDAGADRDDAMIGSDSNIDVVRRARKPYTELRKSLCKTYLSRTQAGPGRAVKEQHKQTSPNHVQELFLSSVDYFSDLAK